MDPFNKYKVYGPTYNKSIDRNMIFLVSPDHRTSMTYARYLMCMEKGRWLQRDEHVDHIDDNRLNDVIGNLQILSQAENNKKNAKGIAMTTLPCDWCGKRFTKRTANIRSTNCCCRSCGGKQSHVTKNMG